MSRRQDRIKTANIICQAARLYKSNLVGEKFLYLFDNRYIEVIYKKNAFKHLTGVDTYLTANEFYKLAIKGQLTERQIYFSSKHPFSLCQHKLKHLKEISNLAVAESFILEEIHTDTKTYKFGTTDLNFSLCFNQDYDNGVLINEVFHVESLRDECCFTNRRLTLVTSVMRYRRHFFVCRKQRIFSYYIIQAEKGDVRIMHTLRHVRTKH